MDEKRAGSNSSPVLQHNLEEEQNRDSLTNVNSCRENNSYTVQLSEVNHDCLKQGDLTVDALHPFFKGYTNRKKDAATNTESRQFYCRECNSFIELRQEQVTQHFSSKKHKPIDACVYCRGDVFEYFYYEKRIIYHKCNTSA